MTNVCKWKTSEGKYNLDLTTLSNKTLSITTSDENDNALLYLLSPCRNGIKCGTEQVMADIVNIHDLQCETYLAVWNGGKAIPTYNSVTNEWKFVYNNGQTCNGEESIFEVIWKCDHNMKSAEIVEIRNIDACTYQMFVNSSLTCG